MNIDLSERFASTEHIAQFFEYEHLPADLRDVSMLVCQLAEKMIIHIADGPELTVGLRKLLEAKDAFVRAALVGRA